MGKVSLVWLGFNGPVANANQQRYLLEALAGRWDLALTAARMPNQVSGAIKQSPPLWQQMLQAVDAIIENQSDQAKLGVMAPRLPPAVEDLRYAGLRAWGLTQVRLKRLVKRPPDQRLVALLSVAFSCLHRSYRADPIVVDQAVQAARAIGREPAVRFINGLLRRVLSDSVASAADLAHPMAQFNAPDWWREKLAAEWGADQAIKILSESQGRAPFCLRLLGCATERAETLLGLRSMDLQVCLDADDDAKVWVHPARSVYELPGFEQGRFRVQDAAAQQLAGWIRISPGDVLLDACAAPGGKSFLLAEQPGGTIWAVDQSAPRMGRMQAEQRRVTTWLKSPIKTMIWDWSRDGHPQGLPMAFDHVILDAPCSASGVVRHHPEIAWRQSPEGLRNLVFEQAKILDKLWLLLKPGGQCWFITCSIFRAEGEDQIRAFLQRCPGATRLNAPGHLMPQSDVLPSGLIRGHDGFFYACLQKTL